MIIEIEGHTIRLTGTNGKAIKIYHNEEDDRFGMSICQEGMEIGCLPSVQFYKNHTICHNNMDKGDIIVNGGL